MMDFDLDMDTGDDFSIEESMLTDNEDEFLTSSRGNVKQRMKREYKPQVWIDDSSEEFSFIRVKGKKYLIDTDDVDKVNQYRWSTDIGGYLKTQLEDGSTLKLHRVVMEETDRNIIIDHINQNRCDNRKKNLRRVDKAQNAFNVEKRSDNTSGHRGVNWVKKLQKWKSYITVDKKKIHLGVFDKLEDAVDARKKAEKEYYGELV